jgi:hypothetical protein
MGFTEAFLKGHASGLAAKQQREQHEADLERRKLERDELALRIKKSKHDDAVSDYELRRKDAETQYSLLNGSGDPEDENAPEPEAVQFPSFNNPDTGETVSPGFKAQPLSARKILSSRLAAMRLEGATKNETEAVPVPKGVVPGVEGKVHPKLLTAATEMAQSRMTASTAASNRENAMNIAELPYTKMGGSGGSIDQIADAVHGGQYKITDVPSKMRTQVMSSLADRGKVVIPPNVREKLDAFNPAVSALDKLEVTLNAATNPKAGAAERAAALLQFRAESSGFTRLVGRSLGEKGMFTDQDAAAFERLMSTGVAGAVLAPDMAKKRLSDLRDFIGQIQEREIGEFFSRQGNAGKVPGPGNLPAKDPGKIRTRHSKSTGRSQWSEDGIKWNEGVPPTGAQ